MLWAAQGLAPAGSMDRLAGELEAVKEEYDRLLQENEGLQVGRLGVYA